MPAIPALHTGPPQPTHLPHLDPFDPMPTDAQLTASQGLNPIHPQLRPLHAPYGPYCPE